MGLEKGLQVLAAAGCIAGPVQAGEGPFQKLLQWSPPSLTVVPGPLEDPDRASWFLETSSKVRAITGCVSFASGESVLSIGYETGSLRVTVGGKVYEVIIEKPGHLNEYKVLRTGLEIAEDNSDTEALSGKNRTSAKVNNVLKAMQNQVCVEDLAVVSVNRLVN